MVAHQIEHLLGRNLLVGFDPQRHTVGEIVTHRIVGVDVHPARDGTEERPHARLATACSTEIERSVSVAEREIFVRTLIKPVLTRESDDIVRIETVLGIVLRELRDARMVGVAADVAVGNAPCDPHDALAIFPLALHHGQAVGESGGAIVNGGDKLLPEGIHKPVPAIFGNAGDPVDKIRDLVVLHRDELIAHIVQVAVLPIARSKSQSILVESVDMPINRLCDLIARIVDQPVPPIFIDHRDAVKENVDPVVNRRRQFDPRHRDQPYPAPFIDLGHPVVEVANNVVADAGHLFTRPVDEAIRAVLLDLSDPVGERTHGVVDRNDHLYPQRVDETVPPIAPNTRQSLLERIDQVVYRRRKGAIGDIHQRVFPVLLGHRHPVLIDPRLQGHVLAECRDRRRYSPQQTSHQHG